MVINPIQFWLSLFRWPLALYIGAPETAKTDKKIAKASIKIAEENQKTASGMIEWMKATTGPIANQQMAAADETQRQSIAQNVEFQTLYPAIGTRMFLDTLGYSEMNDADAEQLVASFGERERMALQNAFDNQTNAITAARERSAAQAAAGTPGASSLTPEYFNEQQRVAQENLNKDLAMAENKYGLVRDTRTSGKAAQEIEAGRAKADVTIAGEAAQRNADRQLWEMGVNPASERGIASRRNMALQTTLNAAGAGTRARSIVSEQQKAGIVNAANYGKGFPAQVSGISATGTQQGNSAVGNVNQTGGGMLAARNASLAGYGTALNANQNIAQAGDNSALWGAAGQVVGQIGAAAIYSSKKFKTHKKRVDHKGILEKVRGLPVEEWEYEPGMTHIPGANAKPGVKHIGPYAEDMKQTFGVGDGKTIHPADQGGIIMAALKELSNKVNKLEQRRAA